MNFKRICFLSLLIGTQYTVFSQVDASSKNKFWDKVRYGGNINLGFSDTSTNLGVAPSAIYQFDNRIAAGVSVGFGYSSFERNNQKQFNYGASALVLYNPIELLQLSAELEQTFVNSSLRIAGQKITDNFNFPALYVGAGYRIGTFSAGLRYDLLYDRNRSIYSSALGPFVRVYF